MVNDWSGFVSITHYAKGKVLVISGLIPKMHVPMSFGLILGYIVRRLVIILIIIIIKYVST